MNRGVTAEVALRHFLRASCALSAGGSCGPDLPGCANSAKRHLTGLVEYRTGTTLISWYE